MADRTGFRSGRYESTCMRDDHELCNPSHIYLISLLADNPQVTWLSGVVSMASTLAPNSVIAYLPPGIRPGGREVFPVLSNSIPLPLIF